MEELIDMASKNDEKWLLNYKALKTYIDEHHHSLAENIGSRHSL